MFYEIKPGSEGRERHADLLHQADEWRLAQQVKTYSPFWSQWSSALLIWLGKQLIGWGRQLQRAT